MGGVAGDMFAASLLDLFPEHLDDTARASQRLAGVRCRLVGHTDGALAGRRFIVEADDAGHHHHAHWRHIRDRIAASGLPEPVRRHAIGIFSRLAEAEARVHGVDPDEVAFHEVGAADSIADIVAAAWLIAAIGPATWSVASLPIGAGRIRTAHGPMPVPAPATALLLEGFATHDDAIAGERVTPTGAAILRHLGASSGPRPSGILRGSGIGLGTRALPGISNCLRALLFDTETTGETTGEATGGSAGHRELAVISFEVDDQSGEELAAGLDLLRAREDVHDVIQVAAFGKKGRLAAQVQVLARPEALEAVVAACFCETTTIGLRTHVVQARTLRRHFAEALVDGRPMQVKRVQRPDGPTGKIEADSLRDVPGHAARTRLRRAAEARVEYLAAEARVEYLAAEARVEHLAAEARVESLAAEAPAAKAEGESGS